MSSQSPLAKRATDLLADDAAKRAFEGDGADDAAMIDVLAEAIVREARKRRHRRIMAVTAGALAVAAAAAIVIGRRAPEPSRAIAIATATPAAAHVAPLVDGTTIVRAGIGSGSSIEDGSPLAVGDRVVSGSGRAMVSLAAGTHLVVEEEADLAVRSLHGMQAFELRAGAVRADVAKLRANERFLIHTRDAEIEVKGTSFRVSVVQSDPSCRQGTITRVAVAEGDVVVRTIAAEEHVLANQSWPPECARDGGVPLAPATAETAKAPPTRSVTAAPAPSVPSRPPQASAPSTPPVPPARASATETSQLAAQTALFADATAARRRGDSLRAIERYEELTRKYPASALAESALVERMRLLAMRDEHAGADAARDYLVRYPHGFARDEAARLAARQR